MSDLAERLTERRLREANTLNKILDWKSPAPTYKAVSFTNDAEAWTVVEIRETYIAKVPNQGAAEALIKILERAKT